MAAVHTFSGSWVVAVLSVDAALRQRFVIEGSDSSDGVYSGDAATPSIAVSGQRWTLRCEWSDNVASGWQASDTRLTGASFTLQEGLVMVIGADDDVESNRDHDFDDLVLRCRSTDPQLNPGIPFTGILDFTLPRTIDPGTGIG